MNNDYARQNRARLRRHLGECTVLLRRNGAFPLEGPCRIGAFGSGVRYTVRGGTGSGGVNSDHFINIEEGLRRAGFEVTGGIWSSLYGMRVREAEKSFRRSLLKNAGGNMIAAAVGAVMKAPEHDIELALDCDAAIYVISRISGEGNDRLPEKGDLKLTDSEVRDILELDRAYEKFMLVINSGGPVDLSPVTDVGNILVLSQLGSETGTALADLLLGRTYPSGKLSATWTALEDYSTAGDFGLRDDVRYREGIYVGYRYFDAFGYEPLYPFGFGLGYTDFRLDRGETSVSGAYATVRVRVSNCGTFRGKEVVQVYISCPSGRLDREPKSLAGFVKTGELAPGESEDVSATFDIRDAAAFDEAAGCWILESGEYILMTGNSVESAEPCAVLELDTEVCVRSGCGRLPNIDFFDLRNVRQRNTDTAGLIRIRLEPSVLRLPEHETGRKHPESETLLADFNAEELAYLNVGNFGHTHSLQNVIGESSSHVAGAAGESSFRFADRGIPGIVMADGPAGLRLAKDYYVDAAGAHPAGPTLPADIIRILPRPVGALAARPGVPGDAEIRHQLCTAVPVGTAVAQSFNIGFAEEIGDIVGGEMERLGVDLWLAPALNIQRNVRCGRNFEYYSEDPVLSGVMAAAVTRGVQKHPGRGVTIKHFAANNQETNRYASSSMVSERALREIYLKGFGICIRESEPAALMTSYNLINGEHTSESRFLNVDILRKEFAYDGPVMTDWVVGGSLLLMKGSKYGIPDPAKAAAAGCSLFMPGSRIDHRAILRGLKEGRVSEAKLRENAGRLVRLAVRLKAEKEANKTLSKGEI